MLATWASISVQAESKPATPKFYTVTNLAEFNLVIDKKAVLASDVKEIDVPPNETRDIIGSDDRIPMTSREKPWSAIGKIEGIDANGQGYSCTGTLIADDLVLTNSHCVVNPDTHKVSQAIAFKPNLINGLVRNKNDITYAIAVRYGTDFKSGELADYIDDWAILKIDRPLGKKYGYLPLKSLPSFDLVGDTRKFALVGYSGDFPNPRIDKYKEFTAGESETAGVHLGCSVLRQKDKLLYHNCDTKSGASGGAIIGNINGNYYVLALHSGWNLVNGLKLNRAVEISRIQAALDGKN